MDQILVQPEGTSAAQAANPCPGQPCCPADGSDGLFLKKLGYFIQYHVSAPCHWIYMHFCRATGGISKSVPHLSQQAVPLGSNNLACSFSSLAALLWMAFHFGMP